LMQSMFVISILIILGFTSFSIKVAFGNNIDISRRSMQLQDGLISIPLVVSSRRRLSNYSMSALYRGYGTHYVDLWVGTPIPQRQTVIVDTGSSITAFPCKGCRHCGFDDKEYHLDSYFDPTLSQTFQKLSCKKCKLGRCNQDDETCQIGLNYVEGSSWQAYEALDLVYTGGTHNQTTTNQQLQQNATSTNPFQTRIHFGCQMSVTGLFRTQLADGIMGMTKHKSSFWHQMYTEGKISHKQFALCLLNERVASRDGTHAGVMTLGGSDTRLHKSQMIYAEESQSPKENYHVYIEKIYLSLLWNSTTISMQSMIEIPLSEKKLITAMIDSGTTDTYFSSAITKPFRNEWRNLMGFDYDSFLPAEEQHRFPTIVLQLRGMSSNSSILVGIPPLNYVSSSTKKKRLETHVHLGSGSTITLGANFMSGYDILFDIEKNRIGFAPSDCQLLATTITDESNSGATLDKNVVHPTNNNSSSITETTKDTIGSSNNKKNITKQITTSKNVKNTGSSVSGGITKPTENKDTSYAPPKNQSNTTANSNKHVKSNTTIQQENSSLSLKNSDNNRGFALSLFVLFSIGGFLIVAILAFVLRSTTMEENEEEDERGNAGESNPLISVITTTNTNVEENDSSKNTNNIII